MGEVKDERGPSRAVFQEMTGGGEMINRYDKRAHEVNARERGQRRQAGWKQHGRSEEAIPNVDLTWGNQVKLQEGRRAGRPSVIWLWIAAAGRSGDGDWDGGVGGRASPVLAC